MKNLVKISAAAIFAASLALSTNAAIKIGGNNTQTTNIQGAVANTAVGGSKAIQNISSNHGKVTIGGNNTQTTNIQGYWLSNNQFFIYFKILLGTKS